MLSQRKNGPRKAKAVVVKGVLYALSPIFFVLILAIILSYRLCRYLYRWIASGAAGVKAILTTFLQRDVKLDMDELDDAIEFTGFSYDPEQDIFFSNMDAWQRDFGYCRLYDEASAPLSMIVDCEPIYFEYADKKWLIEFWKGQYGLTTGGEIGVYATEEQAANVPGVFNYTVYKSAGNTELLQMSFALNKNKEILLARKAKHWWLTGFKLGEFSQPSELTMKVKITLRDEIMCSAFIKGLKKAGYSPELIKKYGNTVIFRFDKPHTQQPVTRIKLTDWLIQKKNKFLCDKYQEITGPYSTLPDKLKALQEKSPRMYKRILNIGRTQDLYEKLKTINNYFN